MDAILEIFLTFLDEINESKTLSRLVRIFFATLFCAVLVLTGVYWVGHRTEAWMMVGGGAFLWLYSCWKALTLQKEKE